MDGGSLAPETLTRMFGSALLIRRVEEAVSQLVGVEFHGATHFCIGQEQTAVAACETLRADDWLFTTHRNRAHLLARGADPGRVLAELLGRSDGYSGGKAGSFHICAPELNVPVTSAIVAGSLPLAVGAGLQARFEGRQRVAMAFFGDGAINEGAFHESVNLAGLWKAAVVFVCENNDAVPYDPRASDLAMRDISEWVGGYDLPAVAVDGSDVEAVFAAVDEAVGGAREGRGPAFVEVRTHKGPLNQQQTPGLACGRFEVSDAWGSGREQPMPEWVAVDPLLKLARRLLERKVCDRDELTAIDEKVTFEADQAVAFAKASPVSPLEAAREGVYAR